MTDAMREVMAPPDAPRMQAFKDRLSPEDIAAVLAFIKTMWTPRPRLDRAPALLLIACVLVGCAAPARPVAFADIAAAETSRHTGGPALIVARTDSARSSIALLRPGIALPDGVVLVAVLQGQQPTGGFTVRITRIERTGERLIVRASFTKPLDNAFVTQALTSPLHVVSISVSDAAGLRDAVLLDETGAEVARGSPR